MNAVLTIFLMLTLGAIGAALYAVWVLCAALVGLWVGLALGLALRPAWDSFTSPD